MKRTVFTEQSNQPASNMEDYFAAAIAADTCARFSTRKINRADFSDNSHINTNLDPSCKPQPRHRALQPFLQRDFALISQHVARLRSG